MSKKIWLYISVSLLFFAVFFYNTCEAEGNGEVNARALNFRLGPGTQFWSMDLLEEGTNFDILAKKSGWYLVELDDGSTGWVYSGYISTSGDSGSLDIDGIGTLEVTASNLNIRMGPGLNYQRFDTLPQGTEARILAEESGWLLIKLNYGSTGWVDSTYTRTLEGLENESHNPGVTVDVSRLNLRLGPGTQYWSRSLLSSGTQLSILGEKNDWFLVELSDGSMGWVFAEHTSNPSANGNISMEGKRNVWVSNDNLNIRYGPGLDYGSFDTLSEGTEGRVLAEENGWLLIKLNYGSTGWVYASYTSDSRVEPPSRGERPPRDIEEGSLQGRIICLDPGHGGHNPGAVGITGLRESEVALNVARKVASNLREMGASVVMTRDGAYDVSLGNRVNIAHRNGADIFVSIHANSHPNPSISGTETYYYSWGNNASSSRHLANLVQTALVNDSGLRDIGVKHGSFYVIRTPWIPSILIELGFLSNYHDESLLRQEWYLQGQARSISNAINSYFNG